MRTHYSENSQGVCVNCGYHSEAHQVDRECPTRAELRERHEISMAIMRSRHNQIMQADFENRVIWPIFWTIVGILVFITMCAAGCEARADVADDILAAMAKEKGYSAKDNVVNYATPGEEATPKPRKYTGAQIKYYT